MPLPAQTETGSTGPWPEMAKPEATDEVSLKLIDLNLKARKDGEVREKLKEFQLRGKLVEGKLQEYKVTYTFAYPGSLRTDAVRTHMGDDYITVTATDGPVVWQQQVTPKRLNPTRLTGLDKQLFELDAMLPYLFHGAADSRHVFQYLGESTYGKRPVYRIHAWLENELRVEIFLDAKTFQAIGYRHPYKVGPKTVLVDRVPMGLKREDGILWETGYNWVVRGKVIRSLTYDRFRPDYDVKAAMFTEPPTQERWLRRE